MRYKYYRVNGIKEIYTNHYHPEKLDASALLYTIEWHCRLVLNDNFLDTVFVVLLPWLTEEEGGGGCLMSLFTFLFRSLNVLLLFFFFLIVVRFNLFRRFKYCFRRSPALTVEGTRRFFTWRRAVLFKSFLTEFDFLDMGVERVRSCCCISSICFRRSRTRLSWCFGGRGSVEVEVGVRPWKVVNLILPLRRLPLPLQNVGKGFDFLLHGLFPSSFSTTFLLFLLHYFLLVRKRFYIFLLVLKRFHACRPSPKTFAHLIIVQRLGLVDILVEETSAM